MNGSKALDISWGTILKVAFGFLAFYVIYLVRDILIWFVFALIISILFNPAIVFLQKFRIPRILAVVFVYVAFFGLLGLFVYMTFPVVISEVQRFVQFFPQYFERIAPSLRTIGFDQFESIEAFTESLTGIFQKTSSDVFNALSVVFGGIASTLFILAMAFFISLEEKVVEKVVGLLVPGKHENVVLSLWQRAQAKVAGWFGARILTCLFIGVAFFITLKLFNVDNALSLALLAGVLDFIPILGPFLVGSIAFVFIALDSVLKAVFVLVAFVLIQQIESNVVFPLLSRKLVDLPPILVLMSVAIGGKILGVLGAILAIPLAGMLFEFGRDFLEKRKSKKAA